MKLLGSPCRSTPREDGFVLIGVIIFVLALTILGLSLFSLSGYEAQFLGQSANRGQAFYLATGGIERAKFALISQKTLQSVKSNLPNEGVVYARARYADAPYESTGTISFSGTRAISIRVLATANGERSMVETQFRPQQSPQYYKRLATSFTHLDINNDASVSGNRPHTYVYGEVWQNDGLPGTATWLSLPAVGNKPTYLPAPVVIPHPDVSSIIDAHPGSPAPTKNGHKYRLYGSPSVPTYFESTSGPGNSFWDDVTTNPEIDVKGIAVWMVRKGMRFNYKVDVESNGGPGDCLVILCEENGNFSGYPGGIWFAAGLKSDDVPVILVADGRVEIEEDLNQPGESTPVDYLSIFAGDISVIGPDAGNGWDMYLHHDLPHPNDASGGLIDRLTNLGVLPNANTQDKLNQVRGQWAQLDPDNPPN